MKQAHRGLRRSLEETVYLIDSTSLRLNELSKDWARFSSGRRRSHLRRQCGLPGLYGGHRRQCERYHGRPGDADRGGRDYVFDLGYYDHSIKARYRTPCYLSAWATLDAAGCRIVTRFKSNTPFRVIEDRSVAKDGAILCDRVGYLPDRKAKTAKTHSAIPFAKCACASKPERSTHPLQRPRQQRRRHRCALQAPLGDSFSISSTKPFIVIAPLVDCFGHCASV